VIYLKIYPIVLDYDLRHVLDFLEMLLHYYNMDIVYYTHIGGYFLDPHPPGDHLLYFSCSCCLLFHISELKIQLSG
jgi:hypothetical protein